MINRVLIRSLAIAISGSAICACDTALEPVAGKIFDCGAQKIHFLTDGSVSGAASIDTGEIVYRAAFRESGNQLSIRSDGVRGKIPEYRLDLVRNSDGSFEFPGVGVCVPGNQCSVEQRHRRLIDLFFPGTADRRRIDALQMSPKREPEKIDRLNNPALAKSLCSTDPSWHA